MKPLQHSPLDGAPNNVAIVIGGGVNVLLDLTLTHNLLNGKPRTYYVINDMIADYSHCNVAVTLHPEKLAGWLEARIKANWLMPQRVYSHITRRSQLVTHQSDDWLGSSGLFAVKIAIENGHRAIILCGVPMDSSLHYRRQKEWKDCQIFRKGWQKHFNRIAAITRSWDGWTAQLLGEPTPEWLDACLESAGV